MRTLILTFLMTLFALLLLSWNTTTSWINEKHQGYNLIYKFGEKQNIKEYIKIIDNGVVTVNNFFNSTFKQDFDIVIHPNRHSLDSAWQKDWNMPDFKSECWMVASGVALKLDVISPIIWEMEACEHKYSDSLKTQQLIIHELVHVFHGQFNASPDFSSTEGIDWFVEGLATYASGQCDSVRILGVKKAIADNNIPNKLDDFWTGKLKYGLSGSMVMFIDKKYGRTKIIELLPLNRKLNLLSTLGITELELLKGWKSFVMKI